MSRILVVDDNLDISSVVKRATALQGHLVETVNTGAEFVAAYQRLLPSIVILDLSLSDTNGNALIDWLSQQRTAARIVLTSGDAKSANELVSVARQNFPALDLTFLPKPFRIPELLALLAPAGHGMSGQPIP
jgi:CheY-like chemotaxis protein